MKKQLLILIFISLFLLLSTTVVVLYARGYRFRFDNNGPRLSGTGLLVVTSNPDGAQVFINGHLTTATNNTISLLPGTYTVKIFKEGYYVWEKKLKVQQEVVTKAEALLFPTAPKLESITSTGVDNPVIDPSLTRIAYTVASQSARKNGVYVLDMTARPVLTLQSASIQIADDTIDVFSKARLSWSPDGQQLLAQIQGSDPSIVTTYLLASSSLNQNPKDITATLESNKLLWQQEQIQKNAAIIETLKNPLKDIIIKNFKILSWSPDETKILYQASQSAQLAILIKPRLLGVDNTPEERDLKQDSTYVYDIKEDKNFKIDVGSQKSEATSPESLPALSWFPDSKHLLFVHNKRIDIEEYDGGNQTTLYAGPFLDNYVFPWPNGSKVIILTNLGNTNITPNLYTISLK